MRWNRRALPLPPGTTLQPERELPVIFSESAVDAVLAISFLLICRVCGPVQQNWGLLYVGFSSLLYGKIVPYIVVGKANIPEK